jgi:hypothetical protein
MTTCAFLPCAEVTRCCLPGGCVTQRFGPQPVKAQSELRADARALNGTKPARPRRDPVWVPRKRKALR